MLKLSREQELLLSVARQHLDDETRDHLRELAVPSLDWQAMYESAERHGLLPLFYCHLSAVCRELAPRAFLDHLRQEFERNNTRNLLMIRELLSILRLLRQQEIEVLSLKGPLLAENVYGGLGLRTVADLDLLINKNDFFAVRDLLRDAGYVMEPQLTPTQLQKHLDFHCEIQLVHKDHSNIIDLHWALAPMNFTGAVSTNEAFLRRKQISVAGTLVDTLSDEDLLLFLCMHAAKHYWTRLEWFAAIAELMQDSQSIDWVEVLSRASKIKAQNMLLLTSLAVRDLFGVDLPEELRRAVEANPPLESHARLLHERLFRQEVSATSQWQMFRMNLILMDAKHHAFAALLRSVFTPTISDWAFVNLPKRMYAFYYFFRPLRLSAKYLNQFVARSKDSPDNNLETTTRQTLSQGIMDR